MTIDARALKCLQNVNLIIKLLCKQFGDIIDIDIDIEKSWNVHISMTIDARALKFLQNVNFIKKILWIKLSDLDLDIDIDIDNLDTLISPWILMLELCNFHRM